MSGKKGFILCVCQGTCPSFTKMDIFGVLSDVRRERSSTMSVCTRSSVSTMVRNS